MAGKDTITLKVDVDAKAAASGLKPLTTALDQTKKAADQTEAELGKLGGDVGKIKINDDAIDSARKEISRLRNQVREDLSMDIDTDTKPALTRIAQLKRTIKALDDETVEIKADVDISGGAAAEIAGLNTASVAAGGSLSHLTDLASGAKLAWGAVGAVIGGAVLGVVKLSADAETARLSLDTLTGSTEKGAAAFEELNKFATQTPFEFDEITSSAQQLLAAGIDTKDLQTNLLAIGDAAAAVSAPIDEVALAYGQMVSKGKVSNEEMLQLQERGIDAYGILARKMSLTTAEINKMASENKLGRDAVELLRQGMEETYGGAMQRQADSLNGKLSTLSDNTKALAKNFGDELAPAVKKTIDLVGKLIIEMDGLMDKRNELVEADKGDDNNLSKLFFGSGLDWLGEAKNKFVELKDVFRHFDPHWSEDKAKRAADHAKAISKATAETKEQLRLSAKADRDIAEADQKRAKAAKDAAKAYKEDTDELKRMAAVFGDIGGDIRTKVSFIFSEADMQEELDKLLGGKDGVELPAHLKLSGLAGLGDKQQQVVETISSSVESGLQEGARRAELNPNFNEVAWYKQVRRKTKGLLIQAGIDRKDLDRVLTNVFGLPRTVPVEANLNPAQNAVKRWTPKPKKVVVSAKVLIDRPTANKPSVSEILDQGFWDSKSPEALIAPKVEVGAANKAKADLGQIAKPGGKGRAAPVDAKAHQPSLTKTKTKLDKLAEDRHMTIFVHTKVIGAAPGAGAGAGAGLTAAPTAGTRSGLVATARALSAAPTATALGSTGYAAGVHVAAGAPAAATPAPTRLAPKQTPVAVYLDGAEISTSLELRARQIASVGTVRRRTA